MKTSLLELLPELVELILFSVGGVALSVVGAYIERFAFATVASGQPELGVWAAVMGAMALYFAYLLLTDKFYPKFTAFRRSLGDA